MSKPSYEELENRIIELLSEKDKSYTYYKHQTATGTGIEAEFAKAVGSSNTNMLSHSTEADDSNKRHME